MSDRIHSVADVLELAATDWLKVPGNRTRPHNVVFGSIFGYLTDQTSAALGNVPEG